MPKKKLTLHSLIADIFKEKLGEAGFSTIVRKHYSETKVHIQGTRKSTALTIKTAAEYDDRRNHRTKWKASDPSTDYTSIVLHSDRMRQNYKIWKSNGTNFADPNFDINLDDLIKNVIAFMESMKEIEENLRKANDIFDKKEWGGSGCYDPKRKRVARGSV